MSASNLSAAQAVALEAVAAGTAVANLLSPSGAVSGAISDILAAASDVFSATNLVNGALANFQSAPVNDPIGAAYSTGQPYGGAFLTAPTTTQIQQINYDSGLSSSTQAVSQLSSAQIAALSSQTGVTINSDADLGQALGTLFSQVQANQALAFSIDLTNTSAITPVTPPAATSTVSPNYSIPPITAAPNMTALQAFVSQIAASFPNTTGIPGIAASIWVDGLGVSVNSSGVPISGVPSDISAGLYSDITNAAGTITGDTAVTVVDYSYQQNQVNFVVALAIDNGLTTILNQLMSSPYVTPATSAVIKNRLASVAQRGDAAMLAQMFAILGANGVPNAVPLLITLLQNVQPTDAMSQTGFATKTSGLTIPIPKPTATTPSFTASGITIATNTNALTRAQIVTYINEVLVELAITPQSLLTSNTCDSILCSMALYNTGNIKQMDMGILESLLDPTTIQMAYMF